LLFCYYEAISTIICSDLKGYLILENYFYYFSYEFKLFDDLAEGYDCIDGSENWSC
jgi:hypothetical protein